MKAKISTLILLIVLPTVLGGCGDVAKRDKNVEILKKTKSCPGCYLKSADLQNLDLRGANLAKANLGSASLSGGDFSRANLEGANISFSNARNANFEGANLKGTDLGSSYLDGANLKDADLSGAFISSKTTLSGANLQTALLVGLNYCGNIITADKKLSDYSCKNINLDSQKQRR